jgi:acyl-CoA thioesterase
VSRSVSPSDPRKLGSPGDVTHPFDADTALEEVGEGRWRGWAPEHWFVARGPNGGYLAALAARAAEAATGRPLRSLALHFVAAPAVGPIDVAVTPEREGRTYSAVTVRLEQDGAPMTLGLATLGALADDGATWAAAAMPEATPLADTQSVPPEQSNVPAFMRNYDLRWAHVTSPGDPSLRGSDGETDLRDPSLRGSDGETDLRPGSGGWMRTREPRLLDAPLVAAMTDAWVPAAFVALGRFVAAPTLDLTIHMRRPLPPAGMVPEDYVLGRFTSRLAVGGVWEEDGELWTPAGELVAQSRPLALVRELPS